jgi:hypothetical protein
MRTSTNFHYITQLVTPTEMTRGIHGKQGSLALGKDPADSVGKSMLRLKNVLRPLARFVTSQVILLVQVYHMNSVSFPNTSHSSK